MAAASVQWVDAGPFRAHLRHVMGIGDLTETEMATLAGVSPRLVSSLLHGRNGRPLRRISPETARSLLRVTAYQARTLRTRQVPSAEPRVRLRKLLASGVTLEDLADELGVAPRALTDLGNGSSWCSGLLALRLVATARARAWQPAAVEGSEVAA